MNLLLIDRENRKKLQITKYPLDKVFNFLLTKNSPYELQPIELIAESAWAYYIVCPTWQSDPNMCRLWSGWSWTRRSNKMLWGLCRSAFAVDSSDHFVHSKWLQLIRRLPPRSWMSCFRRRIEATRNTAVTNPGMLQPS